MKKLMLKNLLKGDISSLLSETLAEKSAVLCTADSFKPAIFVSPVFEQQTGYTASEVIGRSLSFLQGPDTSPNAVSMIRYLLNNRLSGTIKILNYTKSGRPFWNSLYIAPVFDTSDSVSHYVSIQDISEYQDQKE